MSSHPSYHTWVKQAKDIVLPDNIKYGENSLFYDLQCSPGKYFALMMRMTKTIEGMRKKIQNVCPLRTNIIPKYITIDTTTLVHLLITSEMGAKSKLLTKGELIHKKKEIWDMLFTTNKKAFKAHDYVFNHMIDMDGVACSILLIRRDMEGKIIIRKKCKVEREPYIDGLTLSEKEFISARKVIGIDPNMGDLLFCVNKEDDKTTFKYIENQRRQETKAKKYHLIILNEKIHTLVDDKTVFQWESDLSVYNRKTIDHNRFSAFIKAKLLVNSKVMDFYQAQIFRKLKLNTYINTNKSEQWMMKKFEKSFGKPDKLVIGSGDCQQKKHRRHKEPTKGKRFRTLLRKEGYKVYLTDEFKTSCQCSHCQKETEKCDKFRVRFDPSTKKPLEQRQTRLVHGLLIYKECGTLQNRDHNAAINITRLTRNAIDGKNRVKYLTRHPSKMDSAATSTVQNQNLHEDAKPHVEKRRRTRRIKSSTVEKMKNE